MSIFLVIKPQWLENGDQAVGQRFMGHYPFGQLRFHDRRVGLKTRSGEYLRPALKPKPTRPPASTPSPSPAPYPTPAPNPRPYRPPHHRPIGEYLLETALPNEDEWVVVAYRLDGDLSAAVNGAPWARMETPRQEHRPVEFSDSGFVTLGGSNADCAPASK